MLKQKVDLNLNKNICWAINQADTIHALAILNSAKNQRY